MRDKPLLIDVKNSPKRRKQGTMSRNIAAEILEGLADAARVLDGDATAARYLRIDSYGEAHCAAEKTPPATNEKSPDCQQS